MVEESLDTQLTIAEASWPRCAAGTGGAAPVPPLHLEEAQVPSLGPDCREVIRESWALLLLGSKKEGRREGKKKECTHF